MISVLPIRVLGDNVTYLCSVGSRAFVVDPGDAMPVLHALDVRGLTLCAILNTHGHADHVGGNARLQKETGCVVYTPEPGIFGKKNVHTIAEGDRIPIGDHSITVLATPGHSATSVCFYAKAADEQSRDIVWTGDTLFVGGCGRVFSGLWHEMYQSLMRLKGLPDETRVYVGHDYTEENYRFALTIDSLSCAVRDALASVQADGKSDTVVCSSTIGYEKKTNIFFRAHEDEVKRAVAMDTAADWEVFAAVRRKKDYF